MQNRRFMRAQAILNALPIVPRPPITLLALAAKPSVQAYLPTGSSTASVHKLLRKDLLWLEARFGPDIRVEEGGNGRATRYSRTPAGARVHGQRQRDDGFCPDPLDVV